MPAIDTKPVDDAIRQCVDLCVTVGDRLSALGMDMVERIGTDALDRQTASELHQRLLSVAASVRSIGVAFHRKVHGAR